MVSSGKVSDGTGQIPDQCSEWQFVLFQLYWTESMQHVSSLGGPRILLPTQDVNRWIAEVDRNIKQADGLYSLACSIDDYCSVLSPWKTQLLIFGDDPADMYHLPDEFDGLLFQWIGAESLEQLIDFAIAESRADSWDQVLTFTVTQSGMTLMDACTFAGDTATRIQLRLQLGLYTIKTRYAQGSDVMSVIHRFDYVG